MADMNREILDSYFLRLARPCWSSTLFFWQCIHSVEVVSKSSHNFALVTESKSRWSLWAERLCTRKISSNWSSWGSSSTCAAFRKPVRLVINWVQWLSRTCASTSQILTNSHNILAQPLDTSHAIGEEASGCDKLEQGLLSVEKSSIRGVDARLRAVRKTRQKKPWLTVFRGSCHRTPGSVTRHDIWSRIKLHYSKFMATSRWRFDRRTIQNRDVITWLRLVTRSMPHSALLRTSVNFKTKGHRPW